jgi:hypothetical protein
MATRDNNRKTEQLHIPNIHILHSRPNIRRMRWVDHATRMREIMNMNFVRHSKENTSFEAYIDGSIILKWPFKIKYLRMLM